MKQATVKQTVYNEAGEVIGWVSNDAGTHPVGKAAHKAGLTFHVIPRVGILPRELCHFATLEEAVSTLKAQRG